ncbi:MAG: sulfotransferase [Gammaproteobacteria bacterium]|nr:MAG: sulfotransferase [Gammaproteobacteria bacterium]
MIRQTFLDQVLHRLALESRVFRRFWFRRECERNGSAFDPQRQNVFIAGLARAGSTALLDTLYNSGGFASTTYAMMPFVMAPSIARLIARLPRAAVAPAERAHGDAIEVGLDSPEALDGVFWNTFFAQDGDSIQPRDVPPGILREYAMFIENLLLDADAGRYLSKMNQGLDRLGSLAAYFEQSVFLVPFRDPLQQALSLKRQHEHFSHLSGYEKKYFDWLEHHEFGALHRRFSAETVPTGPAAYAASDLNYWLRQWYDGYTYLSKLAGLYPNLLAVCYEHMAQSQSFWDNLSQRLKVDVSGAGFVDRKRADVTSAGDIDDALYRDCQSLYQRLAQQTLSGSA